MTEITGQQALGLEIAKASHDWRLRRPDFLSPVWANRTNLVVQQRNGALVCLGSKNTAQQAGVDLISTC